MKRTVLDIAVSVLLHPAMAAVVLVLLLIFNNGLEVGNAIILVAVLAAFAVVCTGMIRLWRRFVPMKPQTEDEDSEWPVSRHDD